jgi:hypothetical protein
MGPGIETAPSFEKNDEIERAKVVIKPLLQTLRVFEQWFHDGATKVRTIPGIGADISQALRIDPKAMAITVNLGPAAAYVRLNYPVECKIHSYDGINRADILTEPRIFEADTEYDLERFVLRLGRDGEHRMMLVSRKESAYEYEVPEKDGEVHKYTSPRYSVVEVLKIDPEAHDIGFRSMQPDGDVDIAIPGAPVRLKISDFYS